MASTLTEVNDCNGQILVTSCQHNVGASNKLFWHSLVWITTKSSWSNVDRPSKPVTHTKIKSLFWDFEMHMCHLTNITQHSDMQMTCYKKYVQINTLNAVHLQWETGLQESLQVSSVTLSLFKIPAHAHADCDQDRNKLAFQVSWKILITCPELHRIDKCNCAEMESDGGVCVRARRTMMHWRHSHLQPMNM